MAKQRVRSSVSVASADQAFEGREPAEAFPTEVSPEGAVSLQDNLGNEAVAGMVSRWAASGAEGGSSRPGEAFTQGASGHSSAVPYQGEMEAAFGEDFSGVTAHVGQQGAMDDLSARAATQGEEVVFASSAPDKQVVAHELTHVVQQREGGSGVQREGGVSEVGDPAERQADQIASRVAAGQPAQMSQPAAVPTAAISRAANPNAGQTKGGFHVVAAGESLSQIARKWYGDGREWPRIHHANEAAIGPDENVIGVGMRLFIPPKDVQGRMEDEIGKGMDIANTAGNDLEYPDVSLGGQAYPEGYLDPQYWQAVPGTPWSFSLKSGCSASEAIDALFSGPARLECLSMTIAILARSVRETVGAEVFDRNFGKAGDSNQDLVIGTVCTQLYQSKLMGMLESPNPASVADLRPGDWVYFWNHADYHVKHPDGAWGGENAVYKGNGIFSGFGASDKTEGEMNQELLDNLNTGIPKADQLTMPQWKAGKNEDGGNTGLDLSTASRLDASKVEAMLK